MLLSLLNVNTLTKNTFFFFLVASIHSFLVLLIYLSRYLDQETALAQGHNEQTCRLIFTLTL